LIRVVLARAISAREDLQPSTTALSLRLPMGFLEAIKIAAHKRDVPFQSLIEMWLSEKVG
jgi:predicted DNA binding CopG/RHH family protein